MSIANFSGIAASLGLAFGLAMTSAAPAQATVVFSPSEPNIIDFGDVEVGSTSEINWSISWTSDQSALWTSSTASSHNSGFSIVAQNLGCRDIGLLCQYTIGFTPVALGDFARLNYTILTVREPDDPNQPGGPAEYFEYKISLMGRGVAPDPRVVPLPAGLPLLLGALGVLGLIRRKG